MSTTREMRMAREMTDAIAHSHTSSMAIPEAGALAEPVTGEEVGKVLTALLRACRNALRDWPVEFEEGDRARPRLTPTDTARINELRAAIQMAEGLRR